MFKTILGIETSCDETAAAILQKNGDKITILSNVIASSLELQSKWGGVVPEQAAREQLKSIIPVITEALQTAFPQLSPTSYLPSPPIDAIALTQGPGLIGSLLVGVETAKTLSLLWKKPLIPVNHLIGHFYANWITNQLTANSLQPTAKHNAVAVSGGPTKGRSAVSNPSFPCLGLLVSGGHTDLVLFENHGKYTYLGGTRDDAAGECFDKCARLMGLPYPGGPQVSKHAQKGNPHAYPLPKPMLGSDDLDFSFSGLKTAVSTLVGNLTNHQTTQLTTTQLADLCASLQETICQVLIKKTLKAAKLHNVSQIIVAGGVAANQKLKEKLDLAVSSERLAVSLFVPPASLCTDNAAMIAAAAFFQKPINSPLDLQANPNLSLNS